ncbi:YpzG family protein [Lysinibacillus telephonicus]|nr:YpzG family protein [Lysinibacillus telephonicus]
MNPGSKKTYQNWEKPKIQKSQMNGQTEISLHNQILRSEAKARQF